MRCVSPSEVETLFGSLGFSVSLEHAWYRSALRLDEARAKGQVRLAAGQPVNLRSIPSFVGALNRWLPTDSERLFWVDHWEVGQCGAEYQIVEAMRIGLGETRSLEEAPGYLFDKQTWAEEDQLLVPPDQVHAIGLLIGLVSMLLITGSDGWLICPARDDRIEFWEGHFFFHSRDPDQRRRGDAIIDEFNCVRWKS